VRTAVRLIERALGEQPEEDGRPAGSAALLTMELFELDRTELAKLFGVRRQAVEQWERRGVPAERRAKLATTVAIGELLAQKLRPGPASGCRPPARASVSGPHDAGDDRAGPTRRAARGCQGVLRLGDDRIDAAYPAGGAYIRIAGPTWADPLDAAYSVARGCRWKPPGSFPVLYLNRDLHTSRANLERRFAGRPYGPEMLDPARAPLLIQTTVDDADFVDAVTDEVLETARLIDEPQPRLVLVRPFKARWELIGAEPLSALRDLVE
jgi:DNA-binding XRE family transcriptional regulator